MIQKPDIIKYSIMITREVLWIALTMAALYDLKVKAADVMNLCMMVVNRKKI